MQSRNIEGSELEATLARGGTGSFPWRRLVAQGLGTDVSKTRLLQRVLLALVILPHGLQKTFGWFGGWGVDGTLRWFESALGVPAPLALLVILAELLGAVALALGLFSRLSALGIALTMLGAIALVHAPSGFFMNWSGTQNGEGFEYHLLALALSVPLVVKGGGAWSLDTWLSARVHGVPGGVLTGDCDGRELERGGRPRGDQNRRRLAPQLAGHVPPRGPRARA